MKFDKLIRLWKSRIWTTLVAWIQNGGTVKCQLRAPCTGYFSNEYSKREESKLCPVISSTQVSSNRTSRKDARTSTELNLVKDHLIHQYSTFSKFPNLIVRTD